jgi:hypothetical protein
MRASPRQADNSTMLYPLRNRTATACHLWPALLWIIFIGLVMHYTNHTLQKSPSSDDAMFLSVPKNWLSGYGWATSFGEKIPFNPDLTAGPTLLMPAALLIKLFGPQLWIAGITGIAVNFTLIGLCILELRRYWPNKNLCSLIFIGMCIAIHGNDIDSMIGYYTGSLLFLLATITAFNRHRPIFFRAGSISSLFGLALLTKPLMLPAFIPLLLAFYLWEIHPQSSTKVRAASVALLLLPLVLLKGGWHLYQQQGLSQFSSDFQAVWQQYQQDFLHNHGSGIAQWQASTDKWQHLLRNSKKNFYFIEDALNLFQLKNIWIDAPADEHHIAGLLFTGILAWIFIVNIRQINTHPDSKVFAVISFTALIYIGWFVCFSMAMSAGHTYTPIQLGLIGIVLHLCRQENPLTIGQYHFYYSAAAGTALAAFLSGPQLYQRLSITTISSDIPAQAPMVQAAQFLQTNTYTYPLAGCGYSGYPRHLEYLLPGSQNFSDCYAMIEDNAELDEAAYFANNTVDRQQYASAREHFFAHTGRHKTSHHFTWKKPIDMTLVISMQSLEITTRLDWVIAGCDTAPLYQNKDVIILQCRNDKLQKNIDLNKIMEEIAIHQRWYKTRLNPYEGRRF